MLFIIFIYKLTINIQILDYNKILRKTSKLHFFTFLKQHTMWNGVCEPRENREEGGRGGGLMI